MAPELVVLDNLAPYYFFLALTPLNLKIVAFYPKLKTAVDNWMEIGT